MIITEQKETCSDQGVIFRESAVKPRTAFNTYWHPASTKISLAMFGPSILQHGVADESKVRVARVICNRLFENQVRTVGRAIKGSMETEAELIRAYKGKAA